MEETSIEASSFFFLLFKTSRPISADMINVLFTPSLCLMQTSFCVASMLLSAHALSTVRKLCLIPLPS